jgi:hypothetical protein
MKPNGNNRVGDFLQQNGVGPDLGHNLGRGQPVALTAEVPFVLAILWLGVVVAAAKYIGAKGTQQCANGPAPFRFFGWAAQDITAIYFRTALNLATIINGE